MRGSYRWLGDRSVVVMVVVMMMMTTTTTTMMMMRRRRRRMVKIDGCGNTDDDNGGGGYDVCLCAGFLTSQQHAMVCLRDGSAQTCVSASTLRQKSQ